MEWTTGKAKAKRNHDRDRQLPKVSGLLLRSVGFRMTGGDRLRSSGCCPFLPRHDVQRTGFDLVEDGRDVFANQAEKQQLAAAKESTDQNGRCPPRYHLLAEKDIGEHRKHPVGKA